MGRKSKCRYRAGDIGPEFEMGGENSRPARVQNKSRGGMDWFAKPMSQMTTLRSHDRETVVRAESSAHTIDLW